MTFSINLDLVINNLIERLGASIFFIVITSENGVVVKSYINEEEFNKTIIGLNISQIYEISEELTGEIGLESPDFNIIHSSNYYIFSIKFLKQIIILLTLDQVDIHQVFKIINESVAR